MAKIIDFKTREILACFLTDKTPRQARIWNISNGELAGKVAVIGASQTEAMDTLTRVIAAHNESKKDKVA